MSMCDEWMPAIQLPLSAEQFQQLPRNAAYRYEYLGDRAYLSPQPRHYHALLQLRPGWPSQEVELRGVRTADVDDLVPLFAGVFRHIQPYGSLESAMRLQAARHALERTFTGGDGPWIEAASFAAHRQGRLAGAILITLLPATDPCDWDSYRWPEPPPSDCIRRRLGRPHLTWIFVAPQQAGQGIGSTLLAASSNALLELGYRQLASTFMIGNDSSMLWHWRNGFQLLAYPGSVRQGNLFPDD
jgi:GNAT superfamily N-acetyltransferase